MSHKIGSVAAGSWFATATSMAMGGTAVLPLAIGAGAIVGAGAGVGYAGYKAVKYFEKKKKVKITQEKSRIQLI